MINTYILPVETIDGTDTISGSSIIHDALILGTLDPMFRFVIMDTTPDEDAELSTLAIGVRTPTTEEAAAYYASVTLVPPDPDYDRACELLYSSPDVITQPEIWELLRIFGHRLGYPFE